MNVLKLNFTIPKDVAAALKAAVGEGRRSAFVTAAILDRLNELEQEQLRQALVEGYQARREEDMEINSEWERSTLEGWS